MPQSFEWDNDKATANYLKHGISFSEASVVFRDAFAIEGIDPIHSAGELRLITIGVAHTGRLLTVCHTYRVNKIRIINARKATRLERRIYEEG